MTGAHGRFSLTRPLLIVLLTALGACGATGILVFLFGEFDDTAGRILATCAAIAYASLTGLGCAVALERELLRLMAWAGIGVSLLACLSLTIGIWTDFLDRSDEFAKACAILCLFAGALAHTALLSLARLRPQYAWSRYATAAAAFLLVAVLSGIIIFDEFSDEAIGRFIGVLSILVALGTLAVPILHRLSGIPLDGPHETERPEEIELVCPRCHRRQRILIGDEGHCQRCELSIRVEIGGWEESAG